FTLLSPQSYLISIAWVQNWRVCADTPAAWYCASVGALNLHSVRSLHASSTMPVRLPDCWMSRERMRVVQRCTWPGCVVGGGGSQASWAGGLFHASPGTKAVLLLPSAHMYVISIAWVQNVRVAAWTPARRY